MYKNVYIYIGPDGVIIRTSESDVIWHTNIYTRNWNRHQHKLSGHFYLQNNDNIQFKIYRKPTTTDTLILSNSNHPLKYKLSAIRYLANILITHPVTDTYKTRIYNTIRHFQQNNKYHPTILDKTLTSLNAKQHTQQDAREQINKNNTIGPPSHMLKTDHIYQKTLQEYER